MWLKVIVTGLKAAAAGQKPKGAEVFCRCTVNESSNSYQVPDQSLSAFCWPLGPENQSQKEFMAPEEFTFTLTQGDGSRLQGFCRRFLPPAPRVGSRLRYPQVLCLVCEASWAALFFKVLEVTEQLLRQTDILSDFSHQQLPPDSLAGIFLQNLGSVLAQQPALGTVIRVPLPRISVPLAMSPPKRIGAASTEEPLPLLLTEDFIELQVPPDAGNGAANAGVSLARLLWHVPVPAMVTLIASLLLERRVLVVGQSRDMVSAAVCAAQALLHPFRWHHIYLPLLPRSLTDYLTAPMPFLIGLPAQLLPAVKNLPMDEITLIDLDLGRCEPAPGSARDDAQLLPWREQLESALHAAFSMLKSPTEQESNPVIAGIMHGYFLKLLGSYRSHIYVEGTGPGVSPQPPASPHMNGLSLTSPGSRAPGGGGHHRSRSASPLHGGSGGLAAFAPAALGGGGGGGSSISPEPQRSPRSTGGAGSTRHSRHSSSNVGQVDEGMKAHGYWFDHSGLVASHRRNDKARHFLTLLRQSQLFEVFVGERLAMCADTAGGPELSGEAFDQLVNSYLEHRSSRLSARLGAGVRSSLSRFGALIKKHRRTDSTQSTSSFGPSSNGALDRHSLSASGGFGGGLMMGGRPRDGGGGAAGGGLSLGLADRPEAAKMKQMVAAFAAAAEQMKRNLTDSSTKPGQLYGTSSLEAFAEKVVSVFDPSAFFDDDDDDDLEPEAAAAAANSGGAAARLSRSSMSSSSLHDLTSGPMVLPSGASWTAGASSSSRAGPLGTQSVPVGPAGASSGSTSSSSHDPMMQQNGLLLGSSARANQPLGRHSVPNNMASHGADRPPSPAPLIDLEASSSPTAGAGAGHSSYSSSSGSTARVPQQQRYLEQLEQMPAQQQQQHVSPRSPQGWQAHWHQPQQHQHQQQQSSPRSTRESLVQPFLMRPPLPSSGGSSVRSQQHQQQHQHINVKAALAAIPAGPLPQPPPPRTSVLTSSHQAQDPAGQQQLHMQPLRQGLPNLSHVQQQQQQQQQQHQAFHGPGPAAAAAAGAVGSMSSSSSTVQAGDTAWDPFGELLSERMASMSGPTYTQDVQQQPPGVLSVHSGRGTSGSSEGGVSAADSLSGVALAHVAVSSTSTSSSDGGAACTPLSTSTTPAGPTAGLGAVSMLTGPVGDHSSHQQHNQQQPSLQQQPTMPEAWLSAFPDFEGAAPPAQQPQGSCVSCVSLSGRSDRSSMPEGGGGGVEEQQDHNGLVQLKQAFAQQLTVQHSSCAGDDLL